MATIGYIIGGGVDVNDGTIDGATIGASSPSSAVVTTLTVNTAETLAKAVPVYRTFVNNSGGVLATGDVVILNSAVEAGNSVTTTTTVGDSKVAGVIVTGGADGADVVVCVEGYIAAVKVNGTIDIAIGDPLCSYSTAKIARKGTTDTGGCFAIALQAYAVDDSNGVIKAVIGGAALGGIDVGASKALDNLTSVAINTALLPGVDDAVDLGTSTGPYEFKDLYLDGTANIDSLDADTSLTGSGTRGNLSASYPLVVSQASGATAASLLYPVGQGGTLYFNENNAGTETNKMALGYDDSTDNAFVTAVANTNLQLGANNTSQVTLNDGALSPTTDNDIDLGLSDHEYKDLYIDGTANIDSLVADTADINGGTIDGATLGATTPIPAITLDNGGTDGGTIYFNGTTVPFLQAATDGTWVSLYGAGTFSVDGPDDSGVALQLIAYDNDTAGNASVLRSYRSRGTKASPAAVQNGDSLFRFGCFGRDNNSYTQYNTAQWLAAVVGSVTDTQVPTDFVFLTGDGSASPTERLRISSAGVTTATNLVATTADINAGTVDATIGGTTPAAGTFTTATATSFVIGANTLATGEWAALDGIDAAWTSFNPTFSNVAIGTGGSAILEGYYKQIGKTVAFRARAVLGTSDASVSGAVVLTLPVGIATYTTTQFIGIARITAASNVYQGSIASAGNVTVINCSGTYAYGSALSATVPNTFAAGDSIAVAGVYEAA